jgi:peptidyl-tRNA hydrolase
LKTVAEKLYLVVRSDLPAGQQAVQAAHVLREFVQDHEGIERHWYETSNHLAILSVPNEATLNRLIWKADMQGFKYSVFKEPDRGNETTAIALEPAARGLCKHLPLALSSV